MHFLLLAFIKIYFNFFFFFRYLSSLLDYELLKVKGSLSVRSFLLSNDAQRNPSPIEIIVYKENDKNIILLQLIHYTIVLSKS